MDLPRGDTGDRTSSPPPSMPPSRSVRHPRCPRCYPRPLRGPRGVARRGEWRSSCPRRRLTSRSHRPSCSDVALLPLWSPGLRRRRRGRRCRQFRQRLSARPALAIGGRSVVGPDDGCNQTQSEGHRTQFVAIRELVERALQLILHARHSWCTQKQSRKESSKESRKQSRKQLRTCCFSCKALLVHSDAIRSNPESNYGSSYGPAASPTTSSGLTWRSPCQARMRPGFGSSAGGRWHGLPRAKHRAAARARWPSRGRLSRRLPAATSERYMSISGHQWPSVAISGHQWPSVVIRGHQWPSVSHQ